MLDQRGTSGEVHSSSMPIPADLLLRRDRHLRFERGGIVYATDGRIGLLKQVVVDDGACEIVELIIKLDRSQHELRLLPEMVDKTAGSAVFLIADRENAMSSCISHPSQSTRLVKVDYKALNGKAGRLESRLSRPRRTHRFRLENISSKRLLCR